MNPILDQILVGALILGALVYFFLRKKKCNAGCECAPRKFTKKP